MQSPRKMKHPFSVHLLWTWARTMTSISILYLQAKQIITNSTIKTFSSHMVLPRTRLASMKWKKVWLLPRTRNNEKAATRLWRKSLLTWEQWEPFVITCGSRIIEWRKVNTRQDLEQIRSLPHQQIIQPTSSPTFQHITKFLMRKKQSPLSWHNKKRDREWIHNTKPKAQK